MNHLDLVIYQPIILRKDHNKLWFDASRPSFLHSDKIKPERIEDHEGEEKYIPASFLAATII